MTMTNLFSMTEDEILGAASEITSRRIQDAINRNSAETTRLFKLYASKRNDNPHNVGKPKKLTEIEALLLVALERNKYEVEAEQPNKTKWSGTAFCRFNARGATLSMRAESRQDLLLGLWACVSDQGGGTGAGAKLTEAHLQGSIVQRDIRELNSELRRQELEPDEDDI